MTVAMDISTEFTSWAELVISICKTIGMNTEQNYIVHVWAELVTST